MLAALFGKPQKNVDAQLRIEGAVQRFVLDRQHREKNIHLAQEFQAVQSWQSQRLMIHYDELFVNGETSAAARFILQEVYSGDQLAQISREVLKTARKAWRLVPGDMVEAAASAIEANVLTVDLDEKIAAFTLKNGGLSQGSWVYQEALAQKDILHARRLQLAQFKVVGLSVDRYLRGRSVQIGLRMTESLARRAGVINLHQFLTRACSILKDTGGILSLVEHISNAELHLLRSVENGENPFQFMDASFPLGCRVKPALAMADM